MSDTIQETDDKKTWDFFCRELTKGNEIINASRLIIENIELCDNAYNHFWQLVLDSFTAKLALVVNYIFDGQDDALRLTRIITDKNDINTVSILKQEIEDILNFRHKNVGHIGRKGALMSNFHILTTRSLDRIQQLFSSVGIMLNKYGAGKKWGVYAFEWPIVNSSGVILFEHIEVGSNLLNTLDTAERYELRE